MAKEEQGSENAEVRQGGEQMSEAEIDYNIMESFPASDPPSWTLGVRPNKTSREEFEGEKPSPHDPSTKTNHRTHRKRHDQKQIGPRTIVYLF
jgi:hypothetical protein